MVTFILLFLAPIVALFCILALVRLDQYKRNKEFNRDDTHVAMIEPKE